MPNRKILFGRMPVAPAAVTKRRGCRCARAQQAAGARQRLWHCAGCAIAAALLLSASPGHGGAAAGGVLRLRCTNPASGASWPIVVDLARERVDALPATISAAWISWRDPKRGFFDLDRATGKLQLRNASSTGGYFLYYTCRQQP
jgi:hypothetical protein